MKVFISWSGSRSKLIAEALKAFLEDVIQSVKCFMSEADIEAGSRWAIRLLEELETTNFGILCITPENQSADWPLFEAGALAKSVLTSRVCPYLFDIGKSQVKWPLAQFQACLTDENGTRSIVRSINSCLGDTKLDENALNRSFGRCWDEFVTKLDGVPKESPTPTAKRSPEDMLEEVLRYVRPSVRPQTGGDRPKAVIADVFGGFMDGRHFGDTTGKMQDPLNPAAWLRLTDNGRVGFRFKTLTDRARALLFSGSPERDEMMKTLGEQGSEAVAQVYEIIDRFEDDLVIYLRMKHLPGYDA